MRKQIVSACLGLVVISGCKEKELPSSKERAKPQSLAALEGKSTASIPEPVSLPTAEPIIAHPFALEHGQPCKVDHVRRAQDLQELGELKDAVGELRQAAHHTPEDAPTLALLADLSRRTRDFSMAAVVYGELARLQPDDASPLVQKARMLLSLKDAEGALDVVQAALARDPELPEAYHVKGRAKLEQGHLAAAIDAFEETVARQPDHGYAYNNLGLAYLRANENDEALEVLTLAADYLPEVAFVQNNLGVALERVGREEEATLAFEKAVALSPRYVKARINAERMARLASVAGLTPQQAPQPPDVLEEAPVEGEVNGMAPSSFMDGL